MSCSASGERRADSEKESIVTSILDRAREAQRVFEKSSQEEVDLAVAAAGWAVVDPAHNRALAECAVSATGLGRVDDKIAKNHRKTLGLLRDLRHAHSVGVISENPVSGITEVARPVGVVAAITPSTNPAATPANNLINAIKGRNAIVLAPSPKGATTCALLVAYVREALQKTGAPPDLVQQLPQGGKPLVETLMARADLVIATGSRANVEAAYRSGKPALGVGVGNAASIVLPEANLALAAKRIAASKIFDNATSCSSENSLIVVSDAYSGLLEALRNEGGVLASPDEKRRLQATMFSGGRLNPAVIAKTAPEIAALAGLDSEKYTPSRFILVSEEDAGPNFPFSGEKLSPVLTIYRVQDLSAAIALVRRIYDYQGKGHSVGIHGASEEILLRLANEIPASRVIADQMHCFAVGGAFDNGLPFSLSMGCGTWGGNSFSDNLQLRHFLNITRIVRPISPRTVREEDVFDEYWKRFGK